MLQNSLSLLRPSMLPFESSVLRWEVNLSGVRCSVRVKLGGGREGRLGPALVEFYHSQPFGLFVAEYLFHAYTQTPWREGGREPQATAHSHFFRFSSQLTEYSKGYAPKHGSQEPPNSVVQNFVLVGEGATADKRGGSAPKKGEESRVGISSYYRTVPYRTYPLTRHAKVNEFEYATPWRAKQGGLEW